MPSVLAGRIRSWVETFCDEALSLLNERSASLDKARRLVSRDQLRKDLGVSACSRDLLNTVTPDFCCAIHGLCGTDGRDLPNGGFVGPGMAVFNGGNGNERI